MVLMSRLCTVICMLFTRFKTITVKLMTDK